MNIYRPVFTRIKCIITATIIAILVSGCSVQAIENVNASYLVQEVQVKNNILDFGVKVTDLAVIEVIENYFKGFNDIHEWSKYSTEHYVRNVYLWCTGVDTSVFTYGKVIGLHAELQIERADLLSYDIVSFTKISSKSFELRVNRDWNNGTHDTTTYSIIKTGQTWKLDDRF
ncbi:hypothetical protein [Paenibacillus sp. R14(2021)]|uniref:hypothetical protein n=1 Tax=Paenibacillus sp. R14(2021) TaxID=2859228 RepID=UPI001C61518C|nr:hypothetical protein [Paenibacillus sp. R14(2021)]